MANQEVVNAINETIVPNGVKAINADSVRNLLLLMAEKMGEGGGSGSGSGAVRVHVALGDNIDFSQENFEDIDGIGLFTPEEIELIKSMNLKAQQDNMAAYKLLNEHREQGIADLVMGDNSFFTTLFLTVTLRMYDDIINQIYPDMNIDWSPLYINAVVGFPLVCSSADVDTSGLDENSLIMFEEFWKSEGAEIPLNGVSLYEISDEYGRYTLMEDGSVLYENTEDTPTESYEPIIYLSGGENGMTEDMLEANKEAMRVSEAYIGMYWSVRENFSGDVTGSSYWEKGGCVHEIDSNIDYTRKYFRFWKGTDMMQVTVDQDGNATLEVYASINPTA